MKENQFMENQHPLAKLTLLLAMLLSLGATHAQSKILPLSISFAPVGLTMNQTARINFVNLDVPNGMLIRWHVIDSTGLILAQSTAILQMGKIVTVDFKRPKPITQVRAEVLAQVEISNARGPGSKPFA
jgi:hypothetical protein